MSLLLTGTHGSCNWRLTGVGLGITQTRGGEELEISCCQNGGPQLSSPWTKKEMPSLTTRILNKMPIKSGKYLMLQKLQLRHLPPQV